MTRADSSRHHAYRHFSIIPTTQGTRGHGVTRPGSLSLAIAAVCRAAAAPPGSKRTSLYKRRSACS